jgi:hypothetical protein
MKSSITVPLPGHDPATSFKRYFQQLLFDTRNQIVHYGQIDFERSDGERCFSLALALLGFLAAMDRERISKMDEAHKKARQL